MASSNINLGYLPEVVDKIVLNLRNDFTTLQSCVLVNRLWCRLAIPLLWEDPFSAETTGNDYIINIYL